MDTGKQRGHQPSHPRDGRRDLQNLPFLRERAVNLDFLLNPNLAYLLLVFGFAVAFIAILTPGTGALELGALALFLLAGWAVYNLPINPWALVILIAGVFPFVWALRRSGERGYLALSILSLIIGSVFLFRQEQLWQPAVHPLLASVTSLLAGGFFWIAASKALEAWEARPAHDLSTLIGAEGETRTVVHHEGSVYVNGELWSARSQQPIPPGTPIRVVQRSGLLLEVEPIQTNATDATDATNATNATN
ncbi:MAG: hypothetical protein D6803_01250 [Anaerolineae bacterium]|nr:MAG: hypothetical protein D6803_01250 [Anaerolineae bacterium]